MNFWDDITVSLDDLFDEAGLAATYERGVDSVAVTLLPGETTAIDADGHVLADAAEWQVRESEIAAVPFLDQPERGDLLTVGLPAAADGAPRFETWEVARFLRDRSGGWRLFCQRNIRVVP